MYNNKPKSRAKTVNEHQRRATLGSDDDHDEPNKSRAVESDSKSYPNYVATNRRFDSVSRVHLKRQLDADEYDNQSTLETTDSIGGNAKIADVEEHFDDVDNETVATASRQQHNRSTGTSEVTSARTISEQLERKRRLSSPDRSRPNINFDKLNFSDQIRGDANCTARSNDNSDAEEDLNNNHDAKYEHNEQKHSPKHDNFDRVHLVSDLKAGSTARLDNKTTFAHSDNRQRQDNKHTFSLRPRKRFRDQMNSFTVDGIAVSSNASSLANSDNNDGTKSKSNQLEDILTERKKSYPTVTNNFVYQDFDNQSSDKDSKPQQVTFVDRILCSFRKILKQETDPPVTRANKSHSIYELQVCDKVSKFRRASEGSDRTFEWPNVEEFSTKDQSNMVNNYGTSRKKVLLPRDYDSYKRTRRSSSHRRRSQVRLSEGSNAYTRLTYLDFREKNDRSILQELKRLTLLLLIVVICALILWRIYLVLEEDSNYLGVTTSTSKLGVFQNYAVSTDAKHCAQIGKNLLAKGGHAVDAAIGTLLCMGVVLPNSLGLGGGCLMTIYNNNTKQALVIDGREIAPSYAFETMFVNNTLGASRGPLSVGVPGELAAYWEAHQRFGKLNWSELFSETINLAEFGSPMVEHLAFALRDYTHARYITPPLREIYLNKSTNDYYEEGDIVVQPKLAATLKKLSSSGINEFYNGSVGQDFVDDLQKQGGKMTMDDLRSYKVLVKPALDIRIDDNLRLFTQPPPGSGIVLSIIMRIMKELGHFKNSKPHADFESASLFYHHMVESFKFAYAQRAGLEDKPNDERMNQLMKKLLSDEVIKEMAMKVTNQTHDVDYYGGLQYFQEDHGTAHVSVIDSEGNSVAVTTSVNLYFGSGLVSPSTGIIYNDVMDDFVSPGIINKFELKPSKYNRIEPGKRPLSSMAPSIFVDSIGRPILALGASGGAKITTAVATVSLRNTFLDEDIKMAIDAPRVHHQYLPNKIVHENNFPVEYLKSLESRGHVVERIKGRSSVVMGLACNYNNGSKVITANSDYRKGGSVDGL